MSRPKLSPKIHPDQFDAYYWYKDELMEFATLLGVSSSGGKFELHDRISYFLRKNKTQSNKKSITVSDFDWTYAPLSRSTLITDNYRNTKNVRNFLQNELGEKVSFSITVMNWMKDNQGKTLGDFIDCYEDIKNLRKRQAIPEHNQFNQYIRDYLKANPQSSKTEAIQVWKKVIEIPRPGSKGRGIRYSENHLLL